VVWLALVVLVQTTVTSEPGKVRSTGQDLFRFSVAPQVLGRSGWGYARSNLYGLKICHMVDARFG